jgi:hypothetical protein
MIKILIYDTNIKKYFVDLFEIKISTYDPILFSIEYQNIDFLINILNKISKKKLNTFKFRIKILVNIIH